MHREARTVPADFGARLRAARAYADASREDLARNLDLPRGASVSTLRDYERGATVPGPLVADGLIPRLADATGMPEEFFWGSTETAPDLDARLERVEEMLRELLTQRRAATERLARLAPEDAEDAYEFLIELRSLAAQVGRDIPKRGVQAAHAKDRLEGRAKDAG